MIRLILLISLLIFLKQHGALPSLSGLSGLFTEISACMDKPPEKDCTAFSLVNAPEKPKKSKKW